MKRQLERELLDDLPANDPRAVASRGDLRRLNFLMGHVGIVARAIKSNGRLGSNSRIVEVGAGDGTFMLRLAKKLARSRHKAEVTLVDQQKIVPEETLRAFAALGWKAENAQADVFAWLKGFMDAPVDAMTANLFLHHFTEEQLQHMFRVAAQCTRLFVACEPRRGRRPLAATRLLRLIGCNDVTQHDAVISVRAGFRDDELTRLWPDREGWELREYASGLFSHCFVARKK